MAPRVGQQLAVRRHVPGRYPDRIGARRSNASREPRRPPATIRRCAAVDRVRPAAVVPVIRDELLSALITCSTRPGTRCPRAESKARSAYPGRARRLHDERRDAVGEMVGAAPRDIVAKIVVALEAERPPHLERVEVAGPGFVNLYLAPTWLHDVLRSRRRGRATATGAPGATLAGERVNLEFVSVNPTGPLHAGGGRWVAVGDAHRQPARGTGRRGAPRVLPERHRQPARDTFATRSTRGTRASSRPRTGTRASTSSTWPTAPRRERRRRRARRRREWGVPRRSKG